MGGLRRIQTTSFVIKNKMELSPQEGAVGLCFMVSFHHQGPFYVRLWEQSAQYGTFQGRMSAKISAHIAEKHRVAQHAPLSSPAEGTDQTSLVTFSFTDLSAVGELQTDLVL